MDNQYILDQLELTAKLLELHDQNEFKIRGFNTAVFNLDKFSGDLTTISVDELSKMFGVGKSIASKIDEIRTTGICQDLTDLLNDTPEGVVGMFSIKGIGSKKIKLIWKELNITDTHELLLACENGEVAKLKGFGDKIQATIIENIHFIQSKASKLRMDKGLKLAEEIAGLLKLNFDNVKIVGDILRNNEEVDLVQIVVLDESISTFSNKINAISDLQINKNASPFIWRGTYSDVKVPIEIIYSNVADFPAKCFMYSADNSHLGKKVNGKTLLQTAVNEHFIDDSEIYKKLNLPFILPEMREGANEWDWAEKYKNDDLVQWSDLKGIVHNHSTYSDGVHTLEQMADHCKALGFEYFGIADHSKTATYAKGLPVERVEMQHREIDELNKKYANSANPFKILKGIESDILGDGSLDYDNNVLASFDYIVASIHSNLKMNEEKAMSRLIPAIENPFTTILGHPTGRLLLERGGYPVDHRKMIDACAANGVVIEINASPYRLDMDWRWIYYAMEKGVMLSINPDAHKMEGFQDMHYGLANARKGGLIKSMTFNALSLLEITEFLSKKKGIYA
jgi:DNA polymerase (family 10)